MSSAAKATSRSVMPLQAGGRVEAGAAPRVRSARQRARRTPLEELTPLTWRA